MTGFGPDEKVLRVNGTDARDAAAQIRQQSAELVDKGDIYNGLALAIQAGITVASEEAMRENRARLLRLSRQGRLQALPQIVAAAYTAAAISAVNTFGDITPREVGLLRDMQRMCSHVIDLAIEKVTTEERL